MLLSKTNKLVKKGSLSRAVFGPYLISYLMSRQSSLCTRKIG